MFFLADLDLQRFPHGLAGDAGDQQIFIEEAHVFGGEGSAVGPLHAFAQINGVDGGVLVHVVALGHVGLEGAVGVDADERFFSGLAGAPLGVALQQGQRAAVLTDLGHFFDHHVSGNGQAIGHSGQILAVQVGGLGVSSFGGGKAHQGQHHCQGQDQGQDFLHRSGSSFDFYQNRNAFADRYNGD